MSPLKAHNFIWTPLKVQRLALAMGGQERSWAWLLERSTQRPSPFERDMLKDLCKRDERHGAASGNASFYAAGRPIKPKVAMFGDGFKINAKAARSAMFATNGNIAGAPSRS